MSVARHGGRKDLPRRHVAVGGHRIAKRIEALEFRVNMDFLRPAGGRGNAKQHQQESAH